MFKKISIIAIICVCSIFIGCEFPDGRVTDTVTLLDLTKIKAERERLEKEREAQKEIEKEAEKESQNESENESLNGVESQPQTNQNQETQQQEQESTEIDSQTETNQESETQTESPQENVQEQTEIPVEEQTQNQEQETEVELTTEPITEPETETEPETGTESEIETQTETEQEPVPDNQPVDNSEIVTTEEPEQEEVFEPMPELPGIKKLTLMVYMAADNDLESHAIQNLKAMEHSDFKDMNILVLLDRAEGYDETNGDWTDTRLFEVIHDETDGNFIVSKRLRCPILGLSATKETELDMGNFNVLRNFITFAKNEYEAEKYALIIWGHGTGWRYTNLYNESLNYRAVAIDDKSNTFICVSEIGKALKNQGVCVVGFDTCFGGVFENIYEIKNSAAYTVASPGVTPASGWDYEHLLEEISYSDFKTDSIAQAMADSSMVRITIFDNSKMQSVMDSFENFSEALSKTIVDSDSRNNVFNSLIKLRAYSYNQYPCDMYLDLRSMADFYASGTGLLAENARKLKNTIDRSARTTNSEYAEIGINFIPKNSASTVLTYHAADYIKDYDRTDQCLFIKESQWWVPTLGAGSGSLLDKLFYQDF